MEANLGLASTEELLNEIETRLTDYLPGKRAFKFQAWPLIKAIIEAKVTLPVLDLEYRTVDGS